MLQSCGKKIQDHGGKILDQTEFIKADITANSVTVTLNHGGEIQQIKGRLLIDAMGSASAIAWQLNGVRAFDSVCPTVGAVVEGFDPVVWDSHYGDVLNSHGDISKGRQLIWEEEGRYPDVIVELTSPSTARTDKVRKKAIYEGTFRTPVSFARRLA